MRTRDGYNCLTMPVYNDLDFIKQGCELSGADWAALLDRESGAWRIRNAHLLSKAAREGLDEFLAQPATDAWLSGTLSGASTRLRPTAPAALDSKIRLTPYPVADTFRIILVGSKKVDAQSQKIWKLLSEFLRRAEGVADVSFLQSELLMPDLESDFPYDLTRALGRVLRAFCFLTKAQGGWLAIRRGETLDVQSQWNFPAVADVSIPIEDNVVWRRVNKTLKPLTLNTEQPDYARIPRETMRGLPKTWACFPLVISERLIGVVVLWRQKPLDRELLQSLEVLAAQVAPVVEIIITFSSMTEHMRRLAVLNDFAVTVSSAQNLEQIARRVFDLLARAFKTDKIILHLLSVDGRLIREYDNRAEKLVPLNLELRKHPIASFLKAGRVRRISSADPSPTTPRSGASVSSLIIPLKYRGVTIGALTLESARSNAFSIYDGHLIGVIASHLAGLVEYSRLREEAEGRARNLGLIHEVVQQVIGLTNKQEIAHVTAGLLTQYFSFELAAVLLADREGELTIRGFGGKNSPAVERVVARNDQSIRDGIPAHVFKSGESLILNDAAQSDLYRPIAGVQAGSVLAVALRDGAEILGVINVERSGPNAFTRGDLLDVESLAGILTSVVSSAGQYQKLQDTIRQSRAMQGELTSRIEAQKSAENRLVQAAKLAAVGEMAAGVAHELNNPLTTVTGFVDLTLQDMPADSTFRPDLELVLREARRARDVVRRLLDFARQAESTRASADLGGVLGDVIELTRHLMHTNGVQLQKEIPPGLRWVSMDHNQMKQVFLNLFHNALQAMPGGGTLQVHVREEQRGDRAWLTTSVRDNGQGIDPRIKDRLFEPFFTTKGDQGGTGLGLSVTYGIVTDHGGTIDVESQPGKGSAFIVRLPL